MAISNESLRDERIRSIHGRKLGLDKDDHIVGPRGQRQAVTAATSATTGTQLPSYGHITIDSSNARTWQIDDPVEGGKVSISSISTSTLGFTIVPENASFQSSASSTGGSIVLRSRAAVELVGLSTGLYSVVSVNGTTVFINVTT